MKAVNLLPSEHRGAPKAAGPAAGAGPGKPAGESPFGAFAVLGALAFAVVALAAWILADNSVKDRQAELATLSAEHSKLSARAASLKPYAEFEQLATARVSTVKQLATSRFDWERALRDLSRAIPAGVHLSSLKGSVSKEGAGGSQLRSSIDSPAIELAGCTGSQTSVAKLMSRLRTVRGVTRVTLSKSDKDQTSTTSGGNAAAAGGPTTLCRRKGLPSFELILFFERHAALPGSSTPAGPTGPSGPTGPQGQAVNPAGGAQNQAQSTTAPQPQGVSNP